MVKFAHMADVHLGSWKQQPMQDLNLQSFQQAIDKCIKEKVEFVLIAGDLFDSAYPPIDVLKETFAQFKELKEAKVPCFIIAGSHDYSVSGKTFLDVLEKAGFCKNVEDYEEKQDKLILNPTIYAGTAIYGYPGKKSGLEVEDLRRIKLQEAPGMFRIFMLHTTIDKVKGTLPVDAIETELNQPLKKISLKTKDMVSINIKVTNASTATDQIISEIKKHEISDSVVLLRISGLLEDGKHSDIKFLQIEEFVTFILIETIS